MGSKANQLKLMAPLAPLGDCQYHEIKQDPKSVVDYEEYVRANLLQQMAHHLVREMNNALPAKQKVPHLKLVGGS